MKGIVQQIVENRKKRNLSIEEASQLLHFSPTQLEELETGKREPTASEIVALSQLYHLSYKKLLKKPKKKKRQEYNIKKKQLVGFNRYGMKQGWSIIAIPVLAFIALCLMFTPGFEISNRVVSLMSLLLLTNNAWYMTLGVLVFLIMGFNIIYWSVILACGNYTRARLKVLNNIMLCVFGGLTLAITLIFILVFTEKIRIGGIFTLIILFANVLTQIILLITLNLEGNEGDGQQVYTYHESDLSGYETKHWFTLGVSALALVSFCLLFTITYNGKYWLYAINATMFEVLFNSSNVVGLFIGGLLVAVLLFQVVYWIIICTLKRSDRRKTNMANNILLVVMNIILFIDTVAMMSYFGVEYLTVGGICLYVSLFLTAIYGMIVIPIINCNQKSLYIEDENGFHKVRAVQGQKPGKIMAYKFNAWLQYLLLALLAVLVGISFLDSSLLYVAFAGGVAFLFEIVFLILQQNRRYVNNAIFIFGIILNTVIVLFNIFLLGYSLFGNLNLGGKIALPIVSGAIIFVYACIVFFLKPIRDASNQL